MSYLTFPQGRFTEKKLGAFIDEINERFQKDGADIKLDHHPRNGYQAIDIHRPSDGTCLRTLVTGTPRECAEASRTYYYQKHFDKEPS